MVKKYRKILIIIALLVIAALLLYLNYPKLYVATRKDRLRYCNDNFKDRDSCLKAGCEWGGLGGGAPLGQAIGCK